MPTEIPKKRKNAGPEPNIVARAFGVLGLRHIAWFDEAVLVPLIGPYAQPSPSDSHGWHQGTADLFEAIKEQVHAPAWRRLCLDWILRPRVRAITTALAFHPPIPEIHPLEAFRVLVLCETLNRKAGVGPQSRIEHVPTPTVDELYGRKS